MQRDWEMLVTEMDASEIGALVDDLFLDPAFIPDIKKLTEVVYAATRVGQHSKTSLGIERMLEGLGRATTGFSIDGVVTAVNWPTSQSDSPDVERLTIKWHKALLAIIEKQRLPATERAKSLLWMIAMMSNVGEKEQAAALLDTVQPSDVSRVRSKYILLE